MDSFWSAIAEQIAELRVARTSEDVLRILAPDKVPAGGGTGSGDGFFAGTGGDDTVQEALSEAGWQHLWRKAHYHWAMKAPDGSIITYVEGDIFRGDTTSQH